MRQGEPFSSRSQLSGVDQSCGQHTNPIDVTAEIVANSALLKRVLEIVLNDSNTDSVIIFLGLLHKNGAQVARGIAEIMKVARQKEKPLLVAWMAPPGEAVEILRTAHVPLLFDAVRAAKALAKLAHSQ